jgi:hypothetical protein
MGWVDLLLLLLLLLNCARQGWVMAVPALPLVLVTGLLLVMALALQVLLRGLQQQGLLLVMTLAAAQLWWAWQKLLQGMPQVLLVQWEKLAMLTKHPMASLLGLMKVRKLLPLLWLMVDRWASAVMGWLLLWRCCHCLLLHLMEPQLSGALRLCCQSWKHCLAAAAAAAGVVHPWSCCCCSRPSR